LSRMLPIVFDHHFHLAVFAATLERAGANAQRN
jgi:hypothetical protein